MATNKELSVLLIVICALGSCKAQDSTSLARCRLPPYTIVGQRTQIQFLLSGDPKTDKRDVHIWKVADGTNICEARKKDEFILETKLNLATKDMDIYTREGYSYSGIDEEHFLTIFIEKVGPEHEGMYVVEDWKGSYVCHLKVLAAPPSTQAPNTTRDGVKDSCAVDERFFIMHEEDRNAWSQLTQSLITVVIVTVIASILSLSFFGYLYFRKMSADSKTKTGKEETSPLHSRGQDQTAGYAPGTPLGYFNVLRRGNMNHRPGSRRPRLSDQTGSTDGSGAGGVQPEPGSDNLVIDMGNHDMVQPSVHREDTRRRGATQRTRSS